MGECGATEVEEEEEEEDDIEFVEAKLEPPDFFDDRNCSPVDAGAKGGDCGHVVVDPSLTGDWADDVREGKRWARS